MDAIDDGAGGGEGAGRWGGGFRFKEGAPTGLDYPVNDPGGMGTAKGGDGGQGVEDVSHGAEADHEDTNCGLGVQAVIFSPGRTGWEVCFWGLVRRAAGGLEDAQFLEPGGGRRIR